MTDLQFQMLLPVATDLILFAMLIYYRIHKKFKQERGGGLGAFLDRNIVELIFGIVLAPGLSDLLVGLL